MSFKLSTRSIRRLEGVHPKLVAVVWRAIEVTTVDFSVVEGVRTIAAQKRYFQLGKSKTMRSRHIPSSNACDMACAVDLAPWINGTISWEPEAFTPVADAMKASAYQLGIPLTWGGDWAKFVDCPHFELPWGDYP